MGARWASFFTVSAAVACVPEAVLFLWNLLDARDTDAWLEDNWDVVPRFLLGLAIAAVHALALLVASFTPARVRGDRTLAVLFIGAAIGGLAATTSRQARRRALARDVLQGCDTAHWLFGDDDRPVAGWVSALWLAALSVVCGALLLRRTTLVRG